MRLFRKTVSVPFRALVADLYPGMGVNRAYWQFFGYLLFGTFFDRDTNQLVIDQSLLAEIMGKPLNHCRGIDLLEAFRRDVLSPEAFEWTGWAANKAVPGKCRKVRRLVLHPRLVEALEEERLKIHHDAGRVYFVDGTAFSRAKQAAMRREYQRAATEAMKGVGCNLAGETLEYLNTLPRHLFTKLLKNLPSALLVARGLEDRYVRDIQLRILQTIADQPQPFYAPSPKERTVRIFGMHECMVSLKREVRLAMTRGCSEADLASSQLAICAKLWRIPMLEDFLASGKSFWVHLCEQLGYTVKDKSWLKSAFKEGVYAACYGMNKSHVKGAFTRNLQEKGIENGGARVLASPLMTALFDARERMVERIHADGGGLNCFGKKIELSDDVDAYSVLAQQAQAVELRLLYPVIKLAKEHPDEFTILLWQHDGVTIHFHRRPELWTQRISEAVQSEIDALGIKTRLEWEHNNHKKEELQHRNEPLQNRKERDSTTKGMGRRRENTHSNQWISNLQRWSMETVLTKPAQHNQQPNSSVPDDRRSSPAIERQ